VREQLKRIGRFSDPPVLPPIPSPSPFEARNHIQFGLSAKGRLGFRAAGSHRILPIDECHLPEPPITGVWPDLHLEGIPGIQRVSIRADSHRRTQVSLEADGPPPQLIHLSGTDSAMWLAAGEVTCLQGAERLEFNVLGHPFVVSSPSFFQVHSGLVNSLVRHALGAMTVSPGEVIFDLFAGVGLFSAFLAKAGARVVAIEASPHACADFRLNLKDAASAVLHQGTVEDVLPSLPDRPHAVLVDPPRSGLAPSIIQRLLALAPSRIVYVSCDPSTLARDGRALAAGGYRLEHALPLDMFPQTYHVETLTLWTR
jgi:23S rRNA (uracil1939-C5)-methyltransferase